MKLFAILFIALTTFSACKKEEDTSAQAQKDEQIITDYIASHNLAAKATGSGLYYVITTQGSGKKPSASSSVTVKYKGYLTDGTVFDQSQATGATFSLSSVIKGWTEGMQLYNEGGKGILLIPSKLGYGSKKTGSIPANSVLIFEIELLSVQ